MEPVLVFSVLIVLVTATVVLWRFAQRRARRSRIEPTQHVKRLSPDDMRLRITTFCREHGALELRSEHGHLYVTWRLADVHNEEDEPPPERTYSLELRVREAGTVYARYGEGKVTWVRTEAGEHRSPSVEWDWDMAPDFGGFEPATSPEPAEHAPHTVDGLVIPIRRIVLDGGWAWQPVLEMPIEEDVTGSIAPVARRVGLDPE